MVSKVYSENDGQSNSHQDSQKGMPSEGNINASDSPSGHAGPPHGYPIQQQPQPHHPYPAGYPPYRMGYDHSQHQQHHNNDNMNAYQHPYPSQQQPPMRFPGKPMPGGPPGGPQQQPIPPPGPAQYHPSHMRGNYPPGSGQSISQPTGPTPTLNELLRSSGGANGPGGAPVIGHGHRYPPPGGYEHSSYNGPPHSKAEYPPASWQPGPPPSSARPPVNSYGNPPPPHFQQSVYRQGSPTGGPRGGPPPPQHPQPYYNPPGMHHPSQPPHSQQFPPPPPQSPHYSHPAQRYPGPGPTLRPGENQPPSIYPVPPSGMAPETSGLPPPVPPANASSSEKSTPPPPQSPSVAQQQMNHQGGGNPPSPQQSPRSTPAQSQHPPRPPSTNSNVSSVGNAPSSSPSHRPQGSSPPNNFGQPDIGESNNENGASNTGGPRPSPSPTGSASSRSMSPAVGNQNIPVPPRPSSSQSESSAPPRMSQSPMQGGQGNYPGQSQPMAPPHSMYPSSGKGHSSQMMVPTGHQQPSSGQQSHYPPGHPQQWQQPPQVYGVRPQQQHMMNTSYPGSQSQQPMPPNSYPPNRHPMPNHGGAPPPPPNQYSPYPPQYGGATPPHSWPPNQNASHSQSSSNSMSRSQYLKHHLQHKMNFPSQPPPPQGGYPPGHMGPPQSTSIPSSSPSQTPPPGSQGFPPAPHGPPHQQQQPPPPPQQQQPQQQHQLQQLQQQQQQQQQQSMPPHHQQSPIHHPHESPIDSNQDNSSNLPNNSSNSSSNNQSTPNMVSMGPDGMPVDEVSQQSTLSNASGASGEDTPSSMPRLKKEGSIGHPSFSGGAQQSSGAVPSPGNTSMSSLHEDYGDVSSPGPSWPRTPASPGMNSHSSGTESYRSKGKKPDSLHKLFEMDDNPERRPFLDKLLHYMDEKGTPITATPTISKNPLDLFKLYYLVKERGGFLEVNKEVTKTKVWKEIAGHLGIGASSSAAYTLRKHYTKHLLPFECKFDRGGCDPQPLISQVESSSKKKGSKAAPVPSPGSSNSQDSFSGAQNNTSSSSMDNFPSGYPSYSGGDYPPQSTVATPSTSSPGSTRSLPPTSQAQHSGADRSIIVSNPFDDTSSYTNQNNLQHPQQNSGSDIGPSSSCSTYTSSSFSSSSTTTSSNMSSSSYSGYPPTSSSQGYSHYPPPPNQSTEQYPGSGGGRTPSHPQSQGGDVYSPYGGPQGSGSNPNYPASMDRSMYPSYPVPPGSSSYPPTSSQSQSQQPPPQHSNQPSHSTGPSSTSSSSVMSNSSSEDQHMQTRYSMGPPPPSGTAPPMNYPGRGGGYPPSNQSSPSSVPAPHHAPNGYPNQDYYQQQQQQQPPQPGEQPDFTAKKHSTLIPATHESSSLKLTLQSYPGQPSHPGIGSSSPSPSGKSVPHPNQIRRHDFPGAGKGEQISSSGPYSSYPGQQGSPSQRVPPYDGGQRAGGFMYPPPSPAQGSHGAVGNNASSNRSSPSPAPSPSVVVAQPPPPPLSSQTSTAHASSSSNSSGGGGSTAAPPAAAPPTPANTANNLPPTQKSWIPPEGWPSSGTQYSSSNPRYPGSSQAPTAVSQANIPPSTPTSTPVSSSTPSSTQQPWQGSGSSARGPWPGEQHRYMSPSGPPGHSSWPPGQTAVSRSRSHYPTSGKGSYSGASMPPSSSTSSSSSSLVPTAGHKVPERSMTVSPQPAGPGFAQGASSSSPAAAAAAAAAVATAPPVPTPPAVPQSTPPASKKEITFPPDCIEATTPVLSKRRKMHKTDVWPVDPWRIVMCLKSGLLAETTWALDILSILLYDDNCILYFSLNFLPGLLEILLEHLRKTLILLFGQGIGIDGFGEKSNAQKEVLKKEASKWYDIKEEPTDEDEADVGLPSKSEHLQKGKKILVLQGSKNFTNLSRHGKTVGYVSRDDEPFVTGEVRQWDVDEKLRRDSDSIIKSSSISSNVMEVTKHVVTHFSCDLNIVPIVRQLMPLYDNSNPISSVGSKKLDKEDEDVTVQVKKEPLECNELNGDVPRDEHVNCEDNEQQKENIVFKKSCSQSPKNNSGVGGGATNFSDIKFSGENVDKEGTAESESVVNELGSSSKPLSNCVNGDVSSPSTNDKPSDESSKSEQDDSQNKRESLANGFSDNAVCLDTLDEASNPAVSEKSSTSCDLNAKANTVSNDNDDYSVSNDVEMDDVSGSADNASSKPRESNLPEVKKDNAYIRIKDPTASLKRKRIDEYEDECYAPDEPSLKLVTESQDSLAKRSLSIFNIIRNLTFVPGNDVEFGKSVPFLSLLGKLLLLHHDHPLKSKAKESSGASKVKGEPEDSLEEDSDNVLSEGEDGLISVVGSSSISGSDIDVESCSSLNQDAQWWWEYLHHIREHVLVMLANISGQMDLSQYSEEISRPIFDGLLHWAICPAAYGQDPFPIGSSAVTLSPQKLAIEALCKMSVTQGNVDLLLATPPFSRIEKLCQLLCRSLCRTEDPVIREFSVNLLCYLSGADSGVARTIALQNPCISLLISFIEQAESNAVNIANAHGFPVLRENPDAMGTSLDILRRAATTLLNLSRHPDNRSIFVQQEPRLLQLVMSQILEQKVASIVAQVLYQCSMPEELVSKSFYNDSYHETFYAPSLSRNRPRSVMNEVGGVGVGGTCGSSSNSIGPPGPVLSSGSNKNPSGSGGTINGIIGGGSPIIGIPSSRLSTNGNNCSSNSNNTHSGGNSSGTNNNNNASMLSKDCAPQFPYFNSQIKHSTSTFVPS